MDILDLTLDDEDDSTPPTPTPTPPRPIPRPPPPPPPVPQRRPEVEEGRKVREPIKTSPTIARSVQASGSGLKNGGGSSGRRSGASTVGEAANKTLPKKMEMLELSGDSDSEMEIGGREKVKRLSTAAAATAPRGINQPDMMIIDSSPEPESETERRVSLNSALQQSSRNAATARQSSQAIVPRPAPRPASSSPRKPIMKETPSSSSRLPPSTSTATTSTQPTSQSAALPPPAPLRRPSTTSTSRTEVPRERSTKPHVSPNLPTTSRPSTNTSSRPSIATTSRPSLPPLARNLPTNRDDKSNEIVLSESDEDEVQIVEPTKKRQPSSRPLPSSRASPTLPPPPSIAPRPCYDYERIPSPFLSAAPPPAPAPAPPPLPPAPVAVDDDMDQADDEDDIIVPRFTTLEKGKGPSRPSHPFSPPIPPPLVDRNDDEQLLALPSRPPSSNALKQNKIEIVRPTARKSTGGRPPPPHPSRVTMEEERIEVIPPSDEVEVDEQEHEQEEEEEVLRLVRPSLVHSNSSGILKRSREATETESSSEDEAYLTAEGEDGMEVDGEDGEEEGKKESTEPSSVEAIDPKEEQEEGRGTVMEKAKRGKGKKTVCLSPRKSGRSPKKVVNLSYSKAGKLRIPFGPDEMNTPPEAEPSEIEYLNQQQSLNPWERQLIGPSFPGEFASTITSFRTSLLRQSQFPNPSPSTLFRLMLSNSLREEFNPSGTDRPLIRICPDPTTSDESRKAPPLEFIWTNRIVYDDTIKLTPAPGCSCIGNCRSPKNFRSCSCRKRQEEECRKRKGEGLESKGTIPKRSGNKGFAYKSDGTIVKEVLDNEELIVECNSACGCDASCCNKVVGARRSVSIDIYWTGQTEWGLRNPPTYTDKGGVYVGQPIKVGAVLGVYGGRLITSEEATKRYQKYARMKRNYLFELTTWFMDQYQLENPLALEKLLQGRKRKKAKKEDDFASLYTVDASDLGNWTRFANHSCQNWNAEARFALIDDLEVTRPALFYVAVKEIAPGQQITISYHKCDKPQVGDLTPAQYKKRANDLRAVAASPCHCGDEFCRGYIFESDGPPALEKLRRAGKLR